MQQIINQKMAQMKLYGMQHSYQNILESKHWQSLTHDEMLHMLIQAEWEDRESRKINRLLKAARFRYKASCEELNFTSERNIDKTQLLRLTEGAYIKNSEDILLTGPTGVGKSYIASALGNQACLQGYKVKYYNLQKLFAMLKMSKADGSYLKEIDRIEKQDLLIIDDFGLQNLDSNNRMTLMEIIEDRHGRRSTMVCSQLPVAKWYEVIGDSTIADAILDRLINGAHRIDIKGASMRKNKSK